MADRRRLTQLLVTAAVASLTATMLTPSPQGEPPATSAPATTVLDIAGRPATLPELDALEAKLGEQGADGALRRLVEVKVAEHTKDGEVTLNDGAPILDRFTVSELVDLAAISRQAGMSLPRAVRQLGNQNLFAQVANHAVLNHAETFVGYQVNRADGGAWFGFTGPVPQDIAQMLAEVPAPSTVEQGMAHSYNALNEAASQMTVDLPISTTASLVEREGRIEFSTLEGTTAQREQAAARARAIAAQARIPLSVTHEDEVVGTHDGYARGGAHLTENYASDGRDWGQACTTSFVMTGNHGVGIGTAGHCVTMGGLWKAVLRLHGVDGRSYRWVAPKRYWMDSSGDGALYTIGSFSPMDTFYYEYNGKRSVRGVAYRPGVDAWVCKYGRMTNYTCDTVVRTGVTGQYAGSLVRTEHSYATEGDSGGPWFNGTTAYGVHHGSIGLPGTWLRDNLFTQMYSFHLKGIWVYIR